MGADNKNHRTAFAIGLLDICGIDITESHFSDKWTWNKEKEFTPSLRAVPEYIENFGIEFFKNLYPDHASRAAENFKKMKTEFDYLTVLRFVNKILSDEFGISFKAMSNKKMKEIPLLYRYQPCSSSVVSDISLMFNHL